MQEAYVAPTTGNVLLDPDDLPNPEFNPDITQSNWNIRTRPLQNKTSNDSMRMWAEYYHVAFGGYLALCMSCTCKSLCLSIIGRKFLYPYFYLSGQDDYFKAFGRQLHEVSLWPKRSLDRMRYTMSVGKKGQYSEMRLTSLDEENEGVNDTLTDTVLKSDPKTMLNQAASMSYQQSIRTAYEEKGWCSTTLGEEDFEENSEEDVREEESNELCDLYICLDNTTRQKGSGSERQVGQTGNFNDSKTQSRQRRYVLATTKVFRLFTEVETDDNVVDVLKRDSLCNLLGVIASPSIRISMLAYGEETRAFMRKLLLHRFQNLPLPKGK